jgi:hypothetical protein
MSTDRATLEKWIAETKRNQRLLRTAIVPAAIISIALVFVSRPIGAGAIGLVALVALFGFWIMSSHVVDFETRIEELDRPRPVGRAVRRK